MRSHSKNRFLAVSLAAMFLMVSAFVLIPSENSEASAGVYTGGANTSTAANPYSSVNVQITPTNGMSSSIYVAVGGTVNIEGWLDEGWVSVRVNSVTTGFGLTARNFNMTGTIIKAGTISYILDYEEGNAGATIYAVNYVPTLNLVQRTPYTLALPSSWAEDLSYSDFHVDAYATPYISGSWYTINRSAPSITMTVPSTGTYTLEIVLFFDDGSYDQLIATLNYTLVVAPPVAMEITSTPNNKAVAGTQWSYSPTVSESGYTLTVSGASFLSISGNTIRGTPTVPSGESQNYTVTVTAAKAGFTSAVQTFTLTVYRELQFVTTPTPSLVVTALGNGVYVFDASGSADYSSLSLDLGDGNISDALITQHTYAPGVYTAVLTVTNNNGDMSETQQIVFADENVPTVAYIGQLYRATIEVDVGGNIPTISGAPWISITDYDTDYVVIEGIPASQAYKDVTYPIVVTIGSEIIEWNVTVRAGTSWPIPGFTVTTDGLTVTITSTAVNADRTYYVFYDGGREILTNTAVTKYTYAEAGTYTLTQIVRANIGGTEILESYSRSVTVSAAGTGGDGDDSENLAINALGILITLLMLVASAYAAIKTGRISIGVIAFVVLYALGVAIGFVTGFAVVIWP